MKIGIPRALSYYNFFPFWYGFFTDLGIEIVTAYAFSTENFNRPQKEVEGLMNLFVKNFKRIVSHEKIHKNKVKVKVVGRTELLPDSVREAIMEAEESTKDYDERLFNLAIGYDGRLEIVDAIKKIYKHIKSSQKNSFTGIKVCHFNPHPQ